jgi:hypoxanthine phosphoribosyltransferase
MEKYNYTWSEFDEDIDKIVEWTKLFEFDNIYGIPRGGLVVAVALSHKIEIPVILDSKDITNKTLVVDDIVDSGKTVSKLFEGDKIAMVASLFYDKNTIYIPQFVPNLKEEWVVFPWETNESSKYDNN